MTNLFSKIGVAPEAVIQFKTLDGFSAPLAKQRLLNKSEKKSIAYIAIEPADQRWPPLKTGKASAGPFYLSLEKP